MPGHVLVHMITKLELGGAQLATLYQAGHSRFTPGPHHLLYGPGGMLDEVIEKRQDIIGWPVRALSGPLNLRCDSQALRHVIQILTHIQRRSSGLKMCLHTHSSKAGILGRIAARLCGVPYRVHSIHGFGHQPSMPRPLFAGLWAAERLCAHFTSGFTADSQANLDRAAKEGLLAQKPSCVVRCGIDLAAFTPGRAAPHLRASLHIPAPHDVVLTVACLKPQKDPLTWVRVAELVLQLRPNTVFLWAGDGVLRPQVEAALAAAGISQRCRLLGWRHDVPGLMRLADVVLHTSLWEGLPQVFPQAMATGRPVVATAVDGAPEIITPGQTGYLRAAGDAAGLATDVTALLNRPTLAKAVGAAGQAVAHAFSQAHMVADLDGFYARVTGTA